MCLLPEKYYESCINYNLVAEFNNIAGIQLYPFSVSQQKEATLGYDFGFVVLDGSFLVQYKSPCIGKADAYSWQIDLKQLQTICTKNVGIPAYYILPAFNNILQWYEALDYSYYIDANRLYNQLLEYFGQQTHIIDASFPGLKPCSEFIDKYMGLNKNLITTKSRVLNLDEIEQYLRIAGDPCWVYLVRSDECY